MGPRKKQKIIVDCVSDKTIKLSADQQRAVDMAKKCKLMILCGIPGSGKSETINHIADEDTLLAAPTGTAANVMTQKTGAVAYTVAYILSSLEALQTYYKLKLIVDEASMLSIRDLFMLLYHLRPSRLVLSGDKRQLDTVNGHSSLKSFLKVPRFPRVELNYNFRTLSGTFLSANIETLAKTGKILSKGRPEGDKSFLLTPFKTDTEALNYVVNQYNSDVQILTWINDDVDEINKLTACKEAYGEERVRCIKNYYKDSHLKVTNGTLGVKTLNKITYDNGFVDKLKRCGEFNTVCKPARAITIHASQGQEIKKRGIYYLPESSKKLPLSFPYTAISRFPEKVEVVGKGINLIQMFGLNHYQPFTPEEVDDRFGSSYDVYFVECMEKELDKRSSPLYNDAIFNCPNV